MPQRVRVWATSDHRHYDAVTNDSLIESLDGFAALLSSGQTDVPAEWHLLTVLALQVHPGDGLCVFEDVAAPPQSQSQSQSSDESESKKPRAFVATIAYKFRSTEISKLLSGENFSHFYLFVLVRSCDCV